MCPIVQSILAVMRVILREERQRAKQIAASNETAPIMFNTTATTTQDDDEDMDKPAANSAGAGDGDAEAPPAPAVVEAVAEGEWTCVCGKMGK